MKTTTRTPSTKLRVRAAALPAFSLTISTLVAATPIGSAGSSLSFAGGPNGGTFQVFANGIAALAAHRLDDVRLTALATNGSLDNLRRVNTRAADMGVVYAGDLYQGGRGQLADDTAVYGNVRALAALFPAPAQLVVRADSGLTEVAALAGKRVAVGPSGSGSAASARRFFGSLGLWEQLQPRYLGYQQGAAALGDGQIDALWVFARAPQAAITQAAAAHPLRLLPVWAAAQQGTLLAAHPYYTRATIPAGTYPGIGEAMDTIAEHALWVAGAQVPADLIHRLLAEVFSDAGLAFLHEFAGAAAALQLDEALTGVHGPLHAGALRYWEERGFTLSDALR